MPATWWRSRFLLRSRTRATTVTVCDRTGVVSGGGHIDSPPGAFARDRSLTGKACFAFVSTFKRGATTPEGLADFRFPAGFLGFRSTAHEWLVVAGPDAMCQGTGAVNGATGYSFLLTVREGEGDDADAFRIKIWKTATGAVVYDNQPRAADHAGATTPVTGGSIVVYGE